MIPISVIILACDLPAIIDLCNLKPTNSAWNINTLEITKRIDLNDWGFKSLSENSYSWDI